MSLVNRDDAVAALRAAADLIEQLPDVPRYWLSVEAFNLTATQLADAASIPGGWEKDASLSTFVLRRPLPGGASVELCAPRDQVCVAVPTGNKTTVKKVVTPAQFEDVEVDEVRWECEPVMAKKAS